MCWDGYRVDDSSINMSVSTIVIHFNPYKLGIAGKIFIFHTQNAFNSIVATMSIMLLTYDNVFFRLSLNNIIISYQILL